MCLRPMDYKIIVIFFALIFNKPLFAAEDIERRQILNRIQPISRVTVEGQTQVFEQPEVKQAFAQSAMKLSGEDIFNRHCVICHKDGVAGAPKFRETADWKPRLTPMSLEQLVDSAVKGKNAMPPMGTCGECSKEDIKNAIQYMLPAS